MNILLLVLAIRGRILAIVSHRDSFCVDVGGVEVLDDWALPTVVQKGDKVDLRCNYKLGGENMYSLKWYRDNVSREAFICIS